MARKEIIQIIDDLDGRTATETVEFTFEGIEYGLDLNRKNAAKLRADLQPWMDAASRKTKVGHTPRKPRQWPTGTTRKALENGNGNGSATNTDIRAWAKQKKVTDDKGKVIKVAERGRIPEPVRTAYQLAHQS